MQLLNIIAMVKGNIEDRNSIGFVLSSYKQ